MLGMCLFLALKYSICILEKNCKWRQAKIENSHSEYQHLEKITGEGTEL